MRRLVRGVAAGVALAAGVSALVAAGPSVVSAASPTGDPTTLTTRVSAAQGATLQWLGLSLTVPPGSLSRDAAVKIRRVAVGDYAITANATLTIPASLSIPTSGTRPILARKVGGRLLAVTSTRNVGASTASITRFGEYTSIADCGSAPLGRARLTCVVTRGLSTLPRSQAADLAGPGLVTSTACASGRTATVDLFRWAAVCSPATALDQVTGVAGDIQLSDTVELVDLVGTAPTADGSRIALHADGSVQVVSQGCVAHLKNRNVPSISLTVDQISAMPRSEQTQCAPLYGPAETACPAGTSSTGTESPPAVCTADGRRAVYIAAAAGGRVDLEDYSLVVPPGVLTRDCYAQIRILDPTTRYVEDDTDCAFSGTVTVIAPIDTMLEVLDPNGTADHPIRILHLYPGGGADSAGVVPESITTLPDGRISAQLKNLSPVLPGNASDLTGAGDTCVNLVLDTLSLEDQSLNPEANTGWARSVCGYAATARNAANVSAAGIGSAEYDNITGSGRGYGPKQAAYLCTLGAAVVRQLAPVSSAPDLARTVLRSTDPTTDAFIRSVDDQNFDTGIGLASLGVAGAQNECANRARGGSPSATLRMAIDGNNWSTWDYRNSNQCPCYIPPVVVQPPPPPPPPPPPAVGVSKGAYVHNGNCYTYSCGYVVVSLYNFWGGSHNVRVCDQGGCFYSYNTSSWQSAVVYYGYPNGRVYAIVDGVGSNTMTWY